VLGLRSPVYELRKTKGSSRLMIASAAFRFEVRTRTRGKYCGDLKSAALALLEEIADLRQQFFLPGELGRGRRLFLALELVHEADHDEQHEGDDDEVQRQGEETAPSQHGALLFGVREVA